MPTSTKNSVVVMLALALTACPDDGSTSGSTTDTDSNSNSNSNSNSGTVSVTLDTTMSGSESATDTVSTTATTTDATTESSGPTSEATVNPDSSSSDGSGSDSSGSESGSTTGDGGATIYDIQMEVIPIDSDVEVHGVVVTAVRDPLDNQDRFWAEEPGGGEYSGIVVYAGNMSDALGVPSLQIGDVVDVTGTVDEYFEVTEIDISGAGGTLVVVDSGQDLSPDVVDVSVFNDDLTAEPWESTLVRVEGAPLTVTANPNGNNEYPVSDGTDTVVIDEFIYDSTADAAFAGLGTDATFDAIQGPVNFFMTEWKVMPRAASDLEGYAAP